MPGALLTGPVDAPPVVLIHGLGGSHHTWDRVIPLIERQARVYALDAPGTSSIDDDADAAAEVIPSRAIVVGHSRGGLVATAIAERRPNLARKLIVLCTPWARQSRTSANRPAERALAVPGIGHLVWAAASESQKRRAIASAFAPNTPIPEQFITDLRRTGRRRLVAASHAIDTYLAEAPLADRLAGCGIPAQLVFGELDARVAPPPPDTLTHTRLARVGHTPPWEAPERIARMITDALEG